MSITVAFSGTKSANYSFYNFGQALSENHNFGEDSTKSVDCITETISSSIIHKNGKEK